MRWFMSHIKHKTKHRKCETAHIIMKNHQFTKLEMEQKRNNTSKE